MTESNTSSEPVSSEPTLAPETIKDTTNSTLPSEAEGIVTQENEPPPPAEGRDDEDAGSVDEDDFFEGLPLDTKEIDATHSRIKSMGGLHLSRFQQLQELYLRNNQITKISKDLPASLVKLDLYDNLVHRIQNLDHLVDMTSLDLSYNKIRHIKGVKQLTHLKELYFVQNAISKIEELEGLRNLVSLELGANKIREIKGLETLVSLEELWLGKNKITQLKGLEHLSSLRLLAIPSNRLTEISPTALQALPNLEELYLSQNDLREISGLEGNLRLRTLDVSNNRISHLSGLRHLKHLEEFWASSNLIDSFQEVESELGEQAGLHTIYFEHNPLQKNAGATYRNKLRLRLKAVRQIDATYVSL